MRLMTRFLIMTVVLGCNAKEVDSGSVRDGGQDEDSGRADVDADVDADADADADADTGTDVEFWNVDTSGYAVLDGTRVGPLPPEYFADPTLLSSVNDEGGACYWPLKQYWWPMGFTAVQAPEPPYEIHAMAMYMLSGRQAGPPNCDTTVPVRLLVYVGDEPPSSFVGGAGDLEFPDVPITASVEAVGTTELGEQWVAEVVSGVFAEPVRIEESGTLWLGYSQAVESALHASCAMGVNAEEHELSDADLGQFTWWDQQAADSEGASFWQNTDPDPDGVLYRPLIEAIISG